MRRYLWFVCAAVVACGDGPLELAPRAAGTLTVAIAGLPSGVNAAVTVAGPGTPQAVTSTTTLVGLATGAYTVTAVNVVSGGATFLPTPATQSVSVANGPPSTVLIDYAVAPDNINLAFETVATGLSAPLYLTAPANDQRLFVIEQTGRVRIISNGALLPQPFLDLRSRVSSGGERGLLSIAFHPQYATNGFFFVNFTDTRGDTRVERFRVSSNPDVADTTSTLILTVAQPFANHNGGHVLFGPDGMFYIAMGDGGSGGDPQGHGQNRNSLLGKMLRIDVNGALPYVVPPSNPFVGQPNVRPEIWALGLRNPWRVAFDRVGGQLYIADVGQGVREEINAVASSAAGLNYGWNTMEGSACYVGTNCVRTALTLPVAEYTHADGCSVTGGYVYRGAQLPELVGRYFYTDYCSGWLRSFRLVGGQAVAAQQWDVPRLNGPTSFGEDSRGELYVMAGGTVFRIVRR